MSEIRKAWKIANDAWRAAGATTPCHDSAYLAAREALAKAYDDHYRPRRLDGLSR